jgi:hypothetical protein
MVKGRAMYLPYLSHVSGAKIVRATPKKLANVCARPPSPSHHPVSAGHGKADLHDGHHAYL